MSHRNEAISVNQVKIVKQIVNFIKSDLLRGMVAAVERARRWIMRLPPSLGRGISHEGRASWQIPSNPVGDTNLTVDLLLPNSPS